MIKEGIVTNIGYVREITEIQQHLNRLGYRVDTDGLLGPETINTILKQLRDVEPAAVFVEKTFAKVAWGAKVSNSFKSRVIEIAETLLMPPEGPDWLMACMAFESGRTFSANVKNKISGATGLIQFMPLTAAALGTTTTELAGQNPLTQLDYVERYFEPYKGRLNSIDDVYMAILWPAAIGQPAEFPLWVRNLKHSTAYIQNAGLDRNKDGLVTKQEAASKVRELLAEGKRDDNYA